MMPTPCFVNRRGVFTIAVGKAWRATSFHPPEAYASKHFLSVRNPNNTKMKLPLIYPLIKILLFGGFNHAFFLTIPGMTVYQHSLWMGQLSTNQIYDGRLQVMIPVSMVSNCSTWSAVSLGRKLE